MGKFPFLRVAVPPVALDRWRLPCSALRWMELFPAPSSPKGQSLLAPGFTQAAQHCLATPGHQSPASKACVLFQQLPGSPASVPTLDLTLHLLFDSYIWNLCFMLTHIHVRGGGRRGKVWGDTRAYILCNISVLRVTAGPPQSSAAFPRDQRSSPKNSQSYSSPLPTLPYAHYRVTSRFAQKAPLPLLALAFRSHQALLPSEPCKRPCPFPWLDVCPPPGPRGPDAVCSCTFPFSGSGPPVPAPDLLMQIKQEGELQLQEQQALGVEAWAAGQPDIGEEPWGLSQLDSGAGDVSTDAASGVHSNFSTTIPPTSWQADLPPHHPSSACSDGTLKLNTAASTEDVKIVIKTEVQEEEVVATPVHPTDLEAHGTLFGPGQATRFFPSPVQEGAWENQGGSFPSQDPVLGLREPARPERDMGELSPAVAQEETPPGDWLFGGVRWGWNFRCKPPVGLNPRTGPEGVPYTSPDSGEAVLDPSQAPRPFGDPCKYPGRTKGFGHKPGLKKHPAAPPGGRPFTCATCGKSFQLQVSLSAHQRSCGPPEGAPGAAGGGARDGSALRCGECGRCFTRPAHLIRHRMLHTGERPFPCTECEKRFTERSKLIDHYRTHTGVRPFTCTVCGKSFIRKDHLRKHQRNHAAGAKGPARGQPLPPLPAGPPDPFKSPASKGPLASTDLVTDWTCGLSVLGPSDGADL
ncbi:zinc finger protein 746 isoform X2 [Panthera tigris]|uniref:zinc finger protein 746 isoform X2 n=1 Tax=Panthera tigris TaxID=9694 RepID=UPI001C6F736A|nr:zinc finger protein 746 isoform X2 [Panthera tigris]